MKKGRDEHQQFAQDVDALLSGQAVEPASGDEAYQADLKVAALLGRTRFVPSSEFEARLRHKLAYKVYERQEVRKMSRNSRNSRNSREFLGAWLRPVLLMALGGVLMFGVLFAASPDIRAATQGLLARFVEVDSPWALGPAEEAQTEVPSVAVATSDPVRSEGRPDPPARGEEAEVADTAAVADAAAAPPVAGPEKSALEPVMLPDASDLNAKPRGAGLLSLEEAQAEVDFTIQVPASLPDGYAFQGVMPMPDPLSQAPEGLRAPDDLPTIERPQVVTLFFERDDGEDVLILSERVMVGIVPAEIPLPAGQDSVREVTVNGQAAQYVAGRWTQAGWAAEGRYQLHWQDGDITFDLTSSLLQLDALLTVAESLE